MISGRFMGYLALGNHFTFGKLTVFADFMNRSFVDKMSFLSDNPAIISLSKDKRFSKYFKKYQLISLPSPCSRPSNVLSLM